MDFGSLLSRTWELVWEHKFLIVLGIIVAVTSGGTSGGNFSNFGGTRNFEDTGTGEQGDFQGFNQGDFGDLDMPNLEELAPLMAAATGVVIAVICVLVIVGLVFAYISRVATGAIIAGTNQIETTGASSFGEAWRAGWAKGIRLFLIGLVGGIPMIVTLMLIAILVIPLVSVNTQLEDVKTLAAANGGLIITIIGLFCVGVLVSLVLAAVRTFADRACVLQEKGVYESYVDGWGVLRENLGPAVLLFLIQLGLKVVIGVVLFLPSSCCILWPVMLVLDGTVLAYFTTLWTLAWRGWTGGLGEPVVIEQAPTV